MRERPRRYDGDTWPLVLAGIVLVLQVAPYADLSSDGARYLSLARNLWQGDIAVFGREAVHQAPGYGVALAPLGWLGSGAGGGLVAAAVVVNTLLSAAVVLLSRAWLRTAGFAPGDASAGAATVVCCAAWLENLEHPLSEPLFVTLLLAAGLALDLALRDPQRLRRVAPGWLVAGAVALAAAALVRPVGSIWVAGVAAVALRRLGAVRGAAVTAVVAVAVALPVAGWLAREQAVSRDAGDEPSQLDYLTRGIDGKQAPPGEGVRAAVVPLGRTVVPFLVNSESDDRGWLDPHLLLYVPVTGVLVWGGWLGWRQGRGGVVAAGSLAYLVFLAVSWPYEQGTRFMLPVLPAAVWALWHAARPVLRPRFPEGYRRFPAVLLLAHAGAAAAFLADDRAAAWRGNAAVRDALVVIERAPALPPGSYAGVGFDRAQRRRLSLVHDRRVRSVSDAIKPAPVLVGVDPEPVPPTHELARRHGTAWLARPR